MPRVTTREKAARGASRSCGRCGRTIQPGERYHSWAFRYGGTHYRCAEHRPRPSELTQSKLSAVYSAQEDAEDRLPLAGDAEDVAGIVEDVALAAREVAEEYREAAEAMGAAGEENEQRADELESWADELEGFEPEDPEHSSEELVAEALERSREAASDLIGGCPL